MTLTIQSLKDHKNFSIKEAQDFINYCGNSFLLRDSTAAHLTGFKYKVVNSKRVLTPNPLARDINTGLIPRLMALEIFPQMVAKLLIFAPSVIEGKNQKEADRFYNVCDKLFSKQISPSKEWRDVAVNFYIAKNEVIYKEILRDFANFIADFEETRKLCLNSVKSEPRILSFYNDIFEGYNKDTDWFDFIIEDLKVLDQSFENKIDFPTDLTEFRTFFWNSHKDKKSNIKEMLKKK